MTEVTHKEQILQDLVPVKKEVENSNSKVTSLERMSVYLNITDYASQNLFLEYR